MKKSEIKHKLEMLKNDLFFEIKVKPEYAENNTQRHINNIKYMKRKIAFYEKKLKEVV